MAQRAEVVAGNLDTAVALLRGLPPSHLVFLHTIGMLSLLPPAVVVSHLERHDPTRYWSAVVLASAVAEVERRHAGLWDERDPSFFLPRRSVEGEPRAPLEEAAAAFAARGGIRFDVGVFVEPDHTRQYFTDGLIGGDRRRALAACSPGGRHLLGPSLEHMTPDAMAALGRSLAAATPEPADEMTWRYRLAPEGEDRRERVVVVAKHRGEWLVEQGSW